MKTRPCGHEDWSPGLPCPEPGCWSGGAVLSVAESAPPEMVYGVGSGGPPTIVGKRYRMRRMSLPGGRIQHAWEGPLT